jgi:hypothetical protein
MSKLLKMAARAAPIQQVFESLDSGEIQKWVPKHQVGFDHRCQVTMRKQGNGICS